MDRRELLRSSAAALTAALVWMPALAISSRSAPFTLLRTHAVRQQEQAQLTIRHASSFPLNELTESAIERLRLRLADGSRPDRAIWGMRRSPALSVGREVSQNLGHVDHVELQLECDCRAPEPYNAKAGFRLQRGNAYLLVGPDASGRAPDASSFDRFTAHCETQCDVHLRGALADMARETIWLIVS